VANFWQKENYYRTAANRPYTTRNGAAKNPDKNKFWKISTHESIQIWLRTYAHHGLWSYSNQISQEMTSKNMQNCRCHKIYIIRRNRDRRNHGYSPKLGLWLCPLCHSLIIVRIRLVRAPKLGKVQCEISLSLPFIPFPPFPPLPLPSFRRFAADPLNPARGL